MNLDVKEDNIIKVYLPVCKILEKIESQAFLKKNVTYFCMDNSFILTISKIKFNEVIKKFKE